MMKNGSKPSIMNTFLYVVESVMNMCISSKRNKNMASLKSKDTRNNLGKNLTRVMGVINSTIAPLNPSTIY
jgi:hypothetical protein